MTNTDSVQVGSAAPEVVGMDTEGRPIRLSQYWNRGPVVVVFLRHLGCTFCRQHAVQLKRDYAELRAAGAEVVCVAMGSAKVGKAFRILFELPYPLLMTGDDDTSAYRAYGLSRGTPAQLFGPDAISKGIAAVRLLGTKFIGRLTGDGLQMPGTFVIDHGGTIRMSYRSRHAGDNPPSGLLYDALCRLAQGGSQIEENSSSQSSAVVR